MEKGVLKFYFMEEVVNSYSLIEARCHHVVS